jgi:RHS repeat-associated protein
MLDMDLAGLYDVETKQLTSTGGTFPYAGFFSHGSEGGSHPKAYLNYLVFDRNYVLKDGGFQRISANARETGTDIPHERLAFDGKNQLQIKEPGYVYIWLSNENETMVEVYFDDFKVTHTKSPVVQSDDYYPFGLTFNSYQRENSVENKIKFQRQEHIDDLDLGWVQFKWRNHMPDIGRFFNVDPLADKYVYNSPYAFSENHVTSHVELEGLEKIEFNLVIFEPNRGKNEYRSPSQVGATKRISNTNFTDVHAGTASSKQELRFIADFGNGKVSDIAGIDYDKNFLIAFYDEIVKGGQFQLNYELSAEGNLTIKVKIGDATFNINGTSDGKGTLSLKTTISGVPEADGAVIKAAGTADGPLEFVAGHKQGGTKESTTQIESVPYSENDDRSTSTDYVYRKNNSDKYSKMPTQKDEK